MDVDAMTIEAINGMLWDAIKILVTFAGTLIGAWVVIMKFVYSKFGEFTTELAVTNKTLSNIEQAIVKYEQDYSKRHDKLEQGLQNIEHRLDDVEKEIIELKK